MATLDYNRTEKEELNVFLQTVETERAIWRGIALNKLFVIDREKDRRIGKTVSLKNIAESIGVFVLVGSSAKAKALNDGYKTNVFIGQSDELNHLDDITVLVDECVDFKELRQSNGIRIIGGVYGVDSARYVTVKDAMALEDIQDIPTI